MFVKVTTSDTPGKVLSATKAAIGKLTFGSPPLSPPPLSPPPSPSPETVIVAVADVAGALTPSAVNKYTEKVPSSLN